MNLSILKKIIVLPGQYYDEETNLHYNHYRYYDPTIGRYITSDPIGLKGGLNTYNYVASNLIVHYDPDGRILLFAPAVPAIGGGVGSGVLSFISANLARIGLSAGLIGAIGEFSENADADQRYKKCKKKCNDTYNFVLKQCLNENGSNGICPSPDLLALCRRGAKEAREDCYIRCEDAN